MGSNDVDEDGGGDKDEDGDGDGGDGDGDGQSCENFDGAGSKGNENVGDCVLTKPCKTCVKRDSASKCLGVCWSTMCKEAFIKVTVPVTMIRTMTTLLMGSARNLCELLECFMMMALQITATEPSASPSTWSKTPRTLRLVMRARHPVS